MTEYFAPLVTAAVDRLAAGWGQPVTGNERQSSAGQRRELALNLSAYLAHRLIRGAGCDVDHLLAAGAAIRPMMRGESGPARLVVGHATYPAIAEAVERATAAPDLAPPERLRSQRP